MRSQVGISCFVAVIVCQWTSHLAGADWPQWRGPQRSGISEEHGLLQEWPTEGPPLRWQLKDVGSGYSTPSVVGDRLYVISNAGLDNESVQARQVRDGKLIWSTRIGKVGNPDQQPAYPGARSTPTVDGDALYVLGSDGDLACLETASGKIRWQKNVRTAFGGKPGKWAYSESPLIDGDLLICTPGGEQATLLAVNKKSGEVVWKSAVTGGDDAGYASVIPVVADGVKQYVQFLAKGVVGVDAATGKFLWRYEKTAAGSPANMPTPVANDGFVYSSTRSGGGLIKLNVKHGSVEAVEQYFSPKLPNSIGGSVKVGDYLYGTGGGGLMCVNFATGELKWQERSVGAGSICFADGRLYLHAEATGEVALVDATPDGYREKGRFTPPNQPERGKAKAWAYPVVSNGLLFLRDLDSLWCYSVSQTK